MARSKGTEEVWPRLVTVGNATVKVYRIAYARSRSGYQFTVTWDSPGGRKRQTHSDAASAIDAARLKAEQLNAGRVEAAHLDREDVATLARARDIVGATPIIAALEEWAAARAECSGHLMDAARAWAVRHGGGSVKRITVAQAIDRYLAARKADGIDLKSGADRTFNPRRGAAVATSFRASLGAAIIGEVTPNQIADWLATHKHAVTRNTHRKRIVALFRWCRKRGYLPLDVMTAAERTDRAKEPREEIGLVSPAELRRSFDLITEKAPEYVPALAIAAFCGLRRAEVHGQRWDDIDWERGTLRVTAAKPGTPQKRLVPLHETAEAWLKQRRLESGQICTNLAMDRVRDICRTAGLDLADNGFRHSWISARVEITGDIPRTSIEAGNTPRVIHKHYRQLMTRDQAEAWFAVRPS